MPEMNNIDIRVFGLPQEKHPDVVRIARQKASEIYVEEKSKLLPADLKPEALTALRKVETAAHNFFRNKFTRLGLTTKDEIMFPEVHYAKREKNHKAKEGGYKEAGYFEPYSGLCVVYPNEKGDDIFDSYSVIAHELSHGTVMGEARFNFPQDKTQTLQSSYAMGMDIPGGNFIALGKGIEEGMVFFDQAEFFEQELDKIDPKEFDRRRQWAETAGKSVLSDDLAKIDQRLYGVITPKLIMPFINVIKPGIRILDKLKVPHLEVQALREYLFARKLCEVFGRRMQPPIGMVTTEDVIKRGRDLLDKERYTKTGEAHRVIVGIIGGKNAKELFALEDHADAAKIDSVMNILAKY
jgi:hypothetical protein